MITFYVTMAAAGYVVELLFGALGIIPTQRSDAVFTAGKTLTTRLSPCWFLRIGGPDMLKMTYAWTGS